MPWSSIYKHLFSSIPKLHQSACQPCICPPCEKSWGSVQITAPIGDAPELFLSLLSARSVTLRHQRRLFSNSAPNPWLCCVKVAVRNTSTAFLHDPDGCARSSNDTLYWTFFFYCFADCSGCVRADGVVCEIFVRSQSCAIDAFFLLPRSDAAT